MNRARKPHGARVEFLPGGTNSSNPSPSAESRRTIFPRTGTHGATDIGRGSLSSELEGYFRRHLEAATKGSRDKPVVFYCLADCWMSWNAAKRAASWGYKQIYWYPDGINGWDAPNCRRRTQNPPGADVQRNGDFAG